MYHFDATIGYADAACAPINFPIAPTLAIPKALAHAGLEKDDIALWEINEAFSVVIVAAEKILGIPRSKINVRGGAIALGHVSLVWRSSSAIRLYLTSLSDLQAVESWLPLLTP